MAIYRPIPTDGRLHLKLGYASSGMMASGSSSLEITGGQLNQAGTQLTTADIGTQISVMFAGPSLPFVPPYPTDGSGTYYPGSMLVSKITGVSAGTGGHMIATLQNAASNNTPADSNNVVVYREVSTDINTPMSVQWTLTTSSRGTLTATIFDRYGVLNVLAGMPVLLYDDLNGNYFGGAIDSVTARNIPGKVPGANPIYWDINAISWSCVLDRRLVSPYYPMFQDPFTGPPGTVPPSGWHGPPAPATPSGWPATITGGVGGNSGIYQPGQFTNMYLGDIINQLLFTYCNSEGLNSNCANGVGPLINFFQANPGKDTVAQAVDNATQAGFSATQSWFWWIDAWKKVFLVPSQTFFAPWNVDETGASGVNSTDASVLLSVNLEATREKLANRVYIDSSQTVGNAITEFYYTDHSTHSFSLGHSVGGSPTVWIGRGLATWPQTVAVKGAAKQSAQWYWSLGDNTIEQETYTTLAQNCGPGPSSGHDTIYVTSPMLINIDGLNVNDMRCMLQIEQEYVRLRSGSMTLAWNVDRGATVRDPLGAQYREEAKSHVAGTSIGPPSPADNREEWIGCTYQPMDKQTFWGFDESLASVQAGIESGTGFWETQISLGAPFYDPQGTQGKKLADSFVQDFGVVPRKFQAETYRPGLAIGQIIYIHLIRPPINDNFLIDQIEFTAADKRQKWTFHAINGALIGDWRKAFLGLNNQFAPMGGGSELTGSPGPRGPGGIWAPGTEVPASGDPLVGAASFTLAQDYFPYQGGDMEPQLTVGGQQQFDDNGAGIPVEFMVRREYIGGTVGQEGLLAAGNPSNIYLPADPGTPLIVNSFAGRIISKIANGYGDNSNLPIRNFTIVSNDTAGNFVCTPEPYTAGCRSGDVFVIRTGRAVGTTATAYDAHATPTTFTDPLWPNPYNGLGITYKGNIGNVALVIAGTGAGQERQLVIDNTYDTITVSPGWAIQPDGTSCIVVLDTATQIYTPALATKSQVDFTGFFSVPNYSGKTVRVEAYLTPSGVEEGAIETVPFREMYIWGAQGTRVVDSGTTRPMSKLDGLTIFDTSGVATTTTTLSGAMDATQTTLTLAASYPRVNGTLIKIDSERMMVTAGAGTDSLTVTRGWGGTTAATHSNGATVLIPGILNWTLVPFSQVPNQEFKFLKAWWGGANDISYVKISPSTSDSVPNELPDGEPYHLLIDASTTYGSYNIKVPDFQ